MICEKCGLARLPEDFEGGRVACRQCRSAQVVAADQEKRLAAGTHQRCSQCKGVMLLWKFDLLPNGQRARNCIKCRDQKSESRARRENAGGPVRPRDELLSLLHSLPGEPGVVLTPMVRCDIPVAP